jgi:hypothetical protein
MAELSSKSFCNVNVTLFEKLGLTGKTFPCPLCRTTLDLRPSRTNGKPYCICNGCGIQIFFRGKQGIGRLRDFVEDQKQFPLSEFNSGSAVDLFTRLVNLREQKKQLTEKQGLIFRDKDLENTILAIDKEIEKLQGFLAEMAGNSTKAGKQ